MNTAAAQTVSITKAAIQDCYDCAELLQKQLIEHDSKTSKENLTKVLESVVSNEDDSSRWDISMRTQFTRRVRNGFVIPEARKLFSQGGQIF